MRVVIIGNGLGAVRAARLLARDSRMKVTLISEEPYFHYRKVSLSLGRILSDSSVGIIHDRIKAIDATRKVVSGKKKYEYDELVVALEPEMGTVADTVGPHTYVIGAGTAGVELAASLSAHTQVSLSETAPTILPRYGSTARKKVARRLRMMGVDVRTGQHADATSHDDVTIDGHRVAAKDIVWASAQLPALVNDKVFKHTAGGRVVVNEHLQAAPHIAVIGAAASTKYADNPATALSDATFIARVLQAKAQKKHMPTYKSVKYPDAIELTRTWAYVESHGVYIAGWLGALCYRLLEWQNLSLALRHKYVGVINLTKKSKNF